MKKSNFIYVLLAFTLALFTLFGFAAKTNQPKPDQLVTTQPSVKKNEANISDQKSEEGYIDYSPEAFEKNKDKRRVLYFYANWCTTCIPANADFLENTNKIPTDTVVFRVNFRDSDTDEVEKQLAEKYKITYQHTFVQLNYAGEVITKWNGGKLQELIKNIN